MSATSTPNLGTVGGQLAEALAYLSSPAAIAGEIAHHQRAIAAGDTSEATRAQLADWQRVAEAQRRLVGGEPEQGALDLTGVAK